VPRAEKLAVGRKLRDARVEVRSGEIVGLAGLLGSGRTEAARAVKAAAKIGYRPVRCADLPFDPELVRQGNWQPLAGYQRTHELMSLAVPPTAIFCANDLMAVGCYEALKELGLRIPDDVAVMGYDDREIAQHLHPPLTTVLLPHLEMGMIAAENLLDLTMRPPGRPMQIKAECPLVERESVCEARNIREEEPWPIRLPLCPKAP
jgi:LacI family transcriptional regulator